MANWGASKKRALMHKRGIEYANGGDRASMVRRTLPERSTNDPPPPAPSKEQLRSDAAAAFIAWREKAKAKGAAE
jgi:hypothetical protein